MPATVLWFRRDLRRGDHPALLEAAAEGDVLPLFVLDPVLTDGAGAVRTAALHQALAALNESLDGALVVRAGRPSVVVPQVAAEVGAANVHISRETTPYGRRRDEQVAAELATEDRRLVATGSPYAIGPGLVLNQSGKHYRVFTPFSRAWRDHGLPAPAADPDLTFVTSVDSEPLPTVDPPEGCHLPEVSEQAARERWEQFQDEALADYDTDRDRPDRDGTSGLSTHLKFGTIHPRTLLADCAARSDGAQSSVTRFVTELAWREFYADVLWHRPDSAWHDFTGSLSSMSYRDPDTDPDAADDLAAWREGRTGYPFVDAGMRQLLTTGWMHNRVRMVTASFLTKHLHIWWPHGARHFMAHLVDGDLASNNHGWQWVAGTGTDAAPYFRVFNPITQGERFDPGGDYVRRYVPELAQVAGKSAHQPWKDLLGYTEGYPEPIVEHREARAEALARYDDARG
ncbi:cryptochrome/photolyase family protein [Demetria terragena]|uniref:cryptochrome/photolyase family protein n=1 Tax=Demetria terragena TaxID=63959 RepID=UPI000366D0D1|nr:deoxyribodipyrimidine photo-lyase [Demetria terragena]